jgi:hypothetical protein
MEVGYSIYHLDVVGGRVVTAETVGCQMSALANVRRISKHDEPPVASQEVA